MVDLYGTDGSEEAVKLLLQAEVGDKFYAVLRDAGVYKTDEDGRTAFGRFLEKFVTA